MSHEWDGGVANLLDELEERDRLIDAWRIALRTIAGGDMQDGRWGRIALEALDKERKP